MNPLQEIKNKLRGIISTKKSGSSVIGVDIGSSSVKIVQLKNDEGVAVLETYGGLSLAPYAEGEVGQVVPVTEEAIVKAINDVFKEANITTKNSVVAIPSASSLVFLIELPPQISQHNINTIVPTEARRYVPVPITEVSLDWWRIPKSNVVEGTDDSLPDTEAQDNEPTKVLVAAIHNDALNKFQNVVKGAKLQTDFFEIEMFSNVRACVGQELMTVMLVDFGAAKTKVSIVERGVIQDFHIINRGGQELSKILATGLGVNFRKAEDLKKKFGLNGSEQYPTMSEQLQSSLEYIISEVNNVILGYERKYQKTLKKILFTGGGAMLKGVVPFAEKKLPAPVSIADPFEKAKAPAFLEPVLEEIGPEFSVAVGLALRKLQ